jgi:hypothetical protein
MAAIGVNFQIDVTKLDKTRFYKGAKGTYTNLTVFIDSEPNQYGKNGLISEQMSKEERDDGLKLPIVGNATIFWTTDADNFKQQLQDQPAPANQPQTDDFDDDIPF